MDFSAQNPSFPYLFFSFFTQNEEYAKKEKICGLKFKKNPRHIIAFFCQIHEIPANPIHWKIANYIFFFGQNANFTIFNGQLQIKNKNKAVGKTFQAGIG